MIPSQEAVLQQIDEVLTRCGVRPGDDPSDRAFKDLPDSAVAALISAALATLHRLGEGTPYARLADEALAQYQAGNPYTLALLVGYLNALRADHAAGHLGSVGEAPSSALVVVDLEPPDESCRLRPLLGAVERHAEGHDAVDGRAAIGLVKSPAAPSVALHGVGGVEGKLAVWWGAITLSSISWLRTGTRSCFGMTDSHPFDPATVRRRARAAWKRAGLQPIGFHESRHTFASIGIAAGLNAKALSTYMGHASVTITYDRYGHLMPGNEEEATGLLDAYLLRTSEGQSRAVCGPDSSGPERT